MEDETGSTTEEQPPTADTVAVVITTFNRCDIAVRAVQAVLTDARVSELVVVDDASSDSTVDALTAIATHDARLTIVALESNVGRTAARQRGAETAAASVVLLLDDDVVASPSLASKHLDHHQKRPGLVVVGYMPVAKSQLSSATSRIYAGEYEGAIDAYRANSAAVLEKLWGGNVSIRRSDVLAVGLVNDEAHDSFHEDLDFGRRCRAFGLTGVFDPSLKAEHLHSRSVDGFVSDAYNRGVSIAKSDDAAMSSTVAPPLTIFGHALVGKVARTILRPAIAVGGRCEEAAIKALRRLALYRGAADHRKEIQ